MKKQHSLLQSFIYAFRGIIHIFNTQRNARIIFLLAILALGLGVILKISHLEMLIILLTIAIVFVAEIFNSMAEDILNIISPQFNHRARQIKDMAAGAVLIASIISAIVGGFTFLKYIF